MASPTSFWEHCILQELSVEIPPRYLFFFFFFLFLFLFLFL